jgi:hypothetical protein
LCSSGGVARRELEWARRGMERNAGRGASRREMGCAQRAHDAKQHAMGESDGEIFLREEMRDTESKQACWPSTHKPRKWRSDGRTDGRPLLSITGKH